MMWYDRAGKPIAIEDVGAINKRVAESVVEKDLRHYWVSTVWLGLDHRWGSGAPLIFETMVFPSDKDGKPTDWLELSCDRYATEAEALAGHAEVVRRVEGGDITADRSPDAEA